MFLLVSIIITTFSQKSILENINSDFIQKLESPTLVLFYTSRCETRNCINILDFMNNLPKIITNVKIYKCDLFFDSVFARREKMENPPILRMYAYSESHNFNGALNAESIQRFVDRVLNYQTAIPITTLKDAEFDQFIAKYDTVFYFFHMKNCQPCQLSWPGIKQASNALRDNYPNLQFVSVESTQQNITNKFGLEQFPDFIISHHGKINRCSIETYAKYYDIVDCIRKYLNPPKEPVPHVESIQVIINNLMFSEFIILGYFEENDQNFEIFVQFARKISPDFHIFYTSDPEAKEKFGITHPSLIMFIPRGSYIDESPKNYTFSGNFSGESLEEFVGSRLSVSVGQLTKENHRLMFWKRPLCLFIFEVSWNKDNYDSTEYFRRNIIRLSQKRPNISFAYGIPQIQNRMRDFNFGISLDYSEFGLGCVDNHQIRYTMPPVDDWNMTEILIFLDEFTLGKRKEYRMTQTSRMRGVNPVTQLTGSNFDKFVLSSNKNWLLFFYDSYIPSVEHPMRIFREFANEYEMTKLAFGEMDISINDPHPSFFSYLMMNPIIIHYSPNSINVYSMEFDKQNLFNFIFPLEDSLPHSQHHNINNEL